MPRVECGVAAVGRSSSPLLLDLAQRASAQVQAEADPSALHAAALIDLLWTPDQRIPIERSIAYLRTASRLAEHRAPILADLSAALLVRAGRDQTPRDVIEAIETADRALRVEPRDAPARFNLALGLDLLGLDWQAEAAWKAYLELDSTSDWAAEARHRMQAPIETGMPTASATAPAPGAEAAEVAAYVRTAPQEALALGWDQLLDEWGAGAREGDRPRADRWVGLARVVGNELAKEGRDATLAEAVHAIDAAAKDPRDTRVLATAHRDYAAGRVAFRAGDYGAARRSFERAISGGARSPALVAWARVLLASVLVYQGRLRAAEAMVRRVTIAADTLTQPALAGRARWVLGTTLMRRGRYEQALRAFQPAATLFTRAGDPEYAGAMLQMQADTRQYLGDPSAEYPAIHQALTALRPYRGSLWAHNLLYFGARFVSSDGFPLAAARIQDEDVRVAERIGKPIYLAEARIARARLSAASGDTVAARQDLASARAIVDALAPGPDRRWFEADLQFADAGISPAGDTQAAIAALDSVVAFFTNQHNAIRLLPVLVARSEASLGLGEVEAATADLDWALALFDTAGARTENADVRASLLESASRLVDRLVLLRLAAGDTGAALADIERARMSLTPVRRAPSGRGRAARTAPAAPAASAGQVAVDYALIGDTLLIWTVTDSNIRLTRTALDRDSLTRTITRVRSALELRADDPATVHDLGALYEWLVRPIERHLGGDGTLLVLIADGDVAGVPFPALHDAVRGRYLLEAHPLRFGVNLRDATRPARGPLRRPRRAMIVSDPALDPRAFPRLLPLPGATVEADSVAALYPGARTLSRAGATRVALEAGLRDADVAHYAGHALFDDVRPEQSTLALAPDSAAGSNGRLSAADIESLDLHRLRLVVLSACETARPRAGRSAGFAGLAGSLLAAGVGGVLGTLWRVDDVLSLPLMVEFHRAYRQSGDAARSLREAQVLLLRSSDPTLRSPAAWAAFRYTGN
jgi:CHAT domain-containing protein